MNSDVEPESDTAQPGGRPFTLSRDGAKLLVEIPKAGSFQVHPGAAGWFFAKSTDFQLVVVKGDTGRVTHLLRTRDGIESKWVKSR